MANPGPYSVLQVLLSGMMSGVPALHWQCGDVYCAFFFLLLLEKPPPIRKHDSVSRFFPSSFSDNREAHPQSFSPCTYIHFRCPFKSYGVNMFHRNPDFTAVYLCESRCGGYGWFFPALVGFPEHTKPVPQVSSRAPHRRGPWKKEEEEEKKKRGVLMDRGAISHYLHISLKAK